MTLHALAGYRLGGWLPDGLDPLTDQQLAGVLMWIPAGRIYLAVALALLVSWIRATEVDDVAVEEAGRHGGAKPDRARSTAAPCR